MQAPIYSYIYKYIQTYKTHLYLIWIYEHTTTYTLYPKAYIYA